MEALIKELNKDIGEFNYISGEHGEYTVEDLAKILNVDRDASRFVLSLREVLPFKTKSMQDALERYIDKNIHNLPIKKKGKAVKKASFSDVVDVIDTVPVKKFKRFVKTANLVGKRKKGEPKRKLPSIYTDPKLTSMMDRVKPYDPRLDKDEVVDPYFEKMKRFDDLSSQIRALKNELLTEKNYDEGVIDYINKRNIKNKKQDVSFYSDEPSKSPKKESKTKSSTKSSSKSSTSTKPSTKSSSKPSSTSTKQSTKPSTKPPPPQPTPEPVTGKKPNRWIEFLKSLKGQNLTMAEKKELYARAKNDE